MKLLLVVFFLFLGIPKSEVGGRGWVFFDLGEVLVSKTDDGHLKSVSNSLSFVKSLRRQGFKLGLIVNLPEKVGQSCSDKNHWLQTYIATQMVEKFDWQLFDQILLPSKDSYRKPHPLLFLSALELACQLQKPVAFVGENQAELFAASRLGFATLEVNASKGFALALEEDFEERMNLHFINAYPPSCNYKDSLEIYRKIDPEKGLQDLERCRVALRK